MLYEGLEGHNGPERDLTIDAMKEAARRLSVKYPIRASAVRYRDGRNEVDGFLVWTGPVERDGETEWLGPSLEVPVRKRLRLGPLRRPWVEVQSVPEAAAEVSRAVNCRWP